MIDEMARPLPTKASVFWFLGFPSQVQQLCNRRTVLFLYLRYTPSSPIWPDPFST